VSVGKRAGSTHTPTHTHTYPGAALVNLHIVLCIFALSNGQVAEVVAEVEGAVAEFWRPQGGHDARGRLRQRPHGDAHVELVGVEDVATLRRPLAVAQAGRPLTNLADPLWFIDVPHLHDADLVHGTQHILAVARPFQARHLQRVRGATKGGAGG
jgi:hypothetical protein